MSKAATVAQVAQPVQKSQMDERRMFSGVKSIQYAEGAGTHAGEQSRPQSRRNAATTAAAVVQMESGLEQLRAALIVIGSVEL